MYKTGDNTPTINFDKFSPEKLKISLSPSAQVSSNHSRAKLGISSGASKKYYPQVHQSSNLVSGALSNYIAQLDNVSEESNGSVIIIQKKIQLPGINQN